MSLRFKKIILLLSDTALFFVSLLAIIGLRYPYNFSYGFSIHLTPFSIILPIWLLVFYIAGLYEPKTLKNNGSFLKTLTGAITINTLLSISFLYLTPFFGITPRLNLFIFLGIFFILEVLWRQIFNKLIYGQKTNRVLLLGDNHSTTTITDYLTNNPQIGYHIEEQINLSDIKNNRDRIEYLLTHHQVNVIIVPQELKHELTLIPSLYKHLNINLEVISTDRFFELVFQKVPLTEIKEIWFLDNIARYRKSYRISKNIFEPLFALSLFIILLPLFILISLAIKLSSRGPVIYKQIRIGREEKEFTFYKFRSMIHNAETNGAEWSRPNDPRLTTVGRLLRQTHLDELPQLLNIIKGELSFVGPRPERPHFVAKLKQEIPFYVMRHLVKPGITGWAQINFRYGSSIDDAKAKLEYELYYLKNRSLFFDFDIIIRTIKTLFFTPK